MGGPAKALFRQSTVSLALERKPHPLPSRLLSVAPPLAIRCPLALLLQSLGRGPCRWLPATANIGGRQSQKGKEPLESGCRTTCSLPFKQRLSPAGLNLATGFSAGEGGWSHVTLGQQRGPNSVPQHLLMGSRGHFGEETSHPGRCPWLSGKRAGNDTMTCFLCLRECSR